MDDTFKKRYFNYRIFIISLLLYAFCYLLLTQSFMFWEVSWHIEGAKRMLHGGTYLTNLYDDNSPPVFMFYIPYALLSKIPALATPNIASLYILLVYAIASYFTYQVLKDKVITPYAIYAFYFASIIWTLFFGIPMLGERESIIFCLFVPYMYMNLFGGDSLSTTNKTIIAFLAAISVSQVPYYLIVPMAIDIIDCIGQRKKLNLYQYLFYLFFILIFAISYFLYPEYYNVLLKLLYYFQAGIDQPYHIVLSSVLFFAVVYSIAITTIFGLFFYRKLIYVKVITIMVLLLLIFVLEHKPWFYHIYPAVFSTVLAFTLIHVDNQSAKPITLNQMIAKKILTVILGLILLVAFFNTTARYIKNFYAYHDKRSPLNRLIQFSRSTTPTHNKTLFFDTRVFPAYLLKLYGHLNVISPWANNWMLPTLVKYQNQPNQSKEYKIGKQKLFQLTLSTLTQQKPTYIFYYQAKHIPYISQGNFDVIDYLKQNKQVSRELDHYTRYRKIDNYIILKRNS